MTQDNRDDIVYSPSVHVVAKTSYDRSGIEDFLSARADTSNLKYMDCASDSEPEEIVEIAGRLCYNSFTRKRKNCNQSYLEHIIECGHGSVLEHVSFSFIITGVSRSLTHELVRHRVGVAYSQESERYVDKSKTRFVIPPALIGNEVLATEWYESVCSSRAHYEAMVDVLEKASPDTWDRTTIRKRAREAARSVLPESTETRIFVTMNARELRHFLTLRGSLQADAEIRRLAIAIFSKLEIEFPNLFYGISVQRSDDNEMFIDNAYPKV